MAYIRSLEENGLFVSRHSGEVFIYDFMLILLDLNDKFKSEYLKEIIIFPNGCDLDISFLNARAFVFEMERLLYSLPPGYLAFVAQSDIAFGTCRQLQIQLESEIVRLRVFRTEFEARKWIHAP
jgi:hypothetical protein